MSQIRNLQAVIRPQNQPGYPLPVPKSKHRKHRKQQEWDENFTQINIPDYRVYQDKFAQGYISILKKNKKFKQYLNVIMKPGGIRAVKKQPSEAARAESNCSESSPQKSRGNAAPSGGSQAPINRNNLTKGVSSAHKKLRGALSHNRRDIQQEYEVDNEQVQSLRAELENVWNINQVPVNHKIKFMESILQLDPRVMCSIIAKELEDFAANHAPIQRVLKAISAREECLKQIEEFSQTQLKSPATQSNADSSTSLNAQGGLQTQIDQVAKYLINLRYLSVHVVECIVLWRDQLRYVSILSQGNRQKFRKQQATPALQVPFITSDNFNYMIKMKNDTSYFSTLEIAKYFNFCDVSRSDPFLITASLQQRNHAVGSGIRAIKQGKNVQPEKLILPLQEQLINKAKACEEVILFERGELKCTPSQQSVRYNLASPGNGSAGGLRVIKDQSAEKDTTKVGSVPQSSQNVMPAALSLQAQAKSSSKQQLDVDQASKVAPPTETQKIQPTPQPAPAQAQATQETPNPVDEQPFTLEPLNLKESEFASYFDTYLKTVDERIVNSYHTSAQIIDKQDLGYERHYIKLTYKGSSEAKGLAIFNIDPTAQNEQRCYIRHVSSTVLGDIKKALLQVVDFIWRKVQCSNIRVEIFHIKEEATGKFQADPDVKNAYTVAGFKWKTLTNDPATGKRAQIMQANKPATAPQFENIRHLDLGREPITIKAGLIMGISKDSVKAKDTSCKASCQMASCLLSSFKQIKESKQITTKYADQNKKALGQIKKYMDIVDKLPAEASFAASRTALGTGLDEALANISSQGLQVALQKQYSEYLTSVLSLVARWPAFDFTVQNGFYYLRIKSKNIMRVKCMESRKQVGSDIAVIPTDDERLKIMIIPIDAANAKNIEKDGLSAEVQRILKNCEVSDKTVSDVFLPSFSVSHKLENLAVKGITVGEGNMVQECQEVAQIDLVKGDYQKEGLIFEPSTDSSLLVKQSFIFVLSDAELEEAIDNLPLIAVKVEQKDWIKKL